MKWFKAKGVRKPVILSLLAVVLLVGGVGIGFALKTQPVAPVKATVQAQPPTRAELLKLVNEQRAKVGVAPLVEDKRLDWSAQAKADDEVIYNYFGHFRDGKFVGQQFIDETGITCTLDDENITAAESSGLAVSYWANSKSHYEAMINPKYTLTGFGIEYAKYIPKANEGAEVEEPTGMANSYVITEHFCQP
jgi:uncharacterized protein YkwD